MRQKKISDWRQIWSEDRSDLVAVDDDSLPEKRERAFANNFLRAMSHIACPQKTFRSDVMFDFGQYEARAQGYKFLAHCFLTNLGVRVVGHRRRDYTL